MPGSQARFIHVDGEHTPECLSQDLELAHAVLNPRGVMVLDDMLHPGYPTLITTVLAYLERHPQMRVMAILDRESITAAAKFVICRADAWSHAYIEAGPDGQRSRRSTIRSAPASSERTWCWCSPPTRRCQRVE